MPREPLARRLRGAVPAFVRYLVASLLLIYAAPKLLGVQFRVERYNYDTPLGQLSDMAVAWSFFAHSYYYQLLIGLAEIAIGFLLLFRRTRTLGVLCAVPVVGNVLLVDYFFRVDAAMPTAVVLFLGVAYLLALEFPRLKGFFWEGQESAAGGRTLAAGPAYGAAVLGVSLGFLACVGRTSRRAEEGAYRIERYLVNGTPLALSAGIIGRDPMLYFEFGNRAMLSLNSKESFGTYAFDPPRRGFSWTVDRTTAGDVLKGTYRTSGDALVLRGRRGADDVEVVLKRVGVGKP